jgi:CheY-like chemotaxis protein
MDLGQIQLVLDNLLSNAREALPGGNGKIRIAVSRVFAADIPQVRRFPLDWRPDKELYACIEVADSGSGMNDSEIGNIFDPFYSTKFIGRGMGLSVVLGVVSSCSGVVTVASEKGKGSSIKVFLPLIVTAPAKHFNPDETVSDSCKGATILLVEDDEVVRQTTSAMLDCLGFSVIEAEDGVRALELFQQNPETISLVLSDLVMPRLDGWGVLTGVRWMNSDIPVILASGFDEEHVFAGEHPEMPYCMLMKPFRMTELKSVLSSALANHAPAAA